MTPDPLVAAVIPIKAFGRGKSRLSPSVDDASRAALAERMFTHVLRLATAVFDVTFVVTRGADVTRIAERLGARVVPDPDRVTGLADVVDAGLRAAAAIGAGTGVVLMADLPRITAADLEALRARCAEAPVVIAPDHKGRHTNALGLTPPTRFATRFGHPESLAEHLRLAGGDAVILDNHALSLDIDLVDDLRHLSEGALDPLYDSPMRTSDRR